MGIAVIPAASPGDFEQVLAMIGEYNAWISIDLSFQHLDEELHELPAKYRPPEAGMFLAIDDDLGPVGCCGFAPLPGERVCELKRLYVRPAARGRGVGDALLRAVIAAATRSGYAAMFLDTLPSMTSARHLYARFGFEPTARYYDNPVREALFFRKDLRAGH